MGVYALTGIQPALLLPSWRPWEPSLGDSECLDQLASLANGADDPEGTGLRIAWFDELRPGDKKAYCDIPGLGSRFSELTLIEEFGDGAIYRFSPSG